MNTSGYVVYNSGKDVFLYTNLVLVTEEWSSTTASLFMCEMDKLDEVCNEYRLVKVTLYRNDLYLVPCEVDMDDLFDICDANVVNIKLDWSHSFKLATERE